MAQPPEDHSIEHQVPSYRDDWDLQMSQSKDIDIRGEVSAKMECSGSD